MDAELNMNKIRRFGELQEEIFQSTEAWVPLITFTSEQGISIHNPFMESSGRFIVDPVKEYGEEPIQAVAAVIDKIEQEMGVTVDEMKSEDLRIYLGSLYYQIEKVNPGVLREISFGGFELTNESEESKASDTVRFGVNTPERFERFIPEAARALVMPVDHGKEIEFCAKYNIPAQEPSLIATVDGVEYEAELNAQMKDVLLSEMDIYLENRTGKSLEEYAGSNVERQIVCALEEEAKKQWYLGDRDSSGEYNITLSADYRENNEFLLDTAYKHRNSEDLAGYIYDEIYDSYFDSIAFYEDELLKGAGFEATDPNYELAREILQERIHFNPDYSHFMKDDVRVNLLLGTAGERNSDFTDIYDNMFEEPDNGLFWLIKQQGYTLRELSDEMADYVNGKEASPDRKFLRSVCEELNNTPYQMGCLTVLMQSSLEELSAYAMHEGSEFVLPKNAMLGIFNPWNGSGSLLEIQLEKDLVIPDEMIWDYQIEGIRTGGYTVDQVYGLVGSCWKPAEELRTPEKSRAKEAAKHEPERSPLDSRITDAQERISGDISEKTEKGRSGHEKSY